MADYTIVEHVLEAKTKRAAIEKAREYNERYAQEARKIFLPIQVHFLLETVRSETKGCRGRYKFNVRILKKSYDKNKLAFYELVHGKPYSYEL